MKNNVKKIITDLVMLGTESKTHYQAWWSLEHSAKLDFSPTINEFVDFFDSTRIAHFNNMIISICAIHKKKPLTSNLNEYLKHAKQLIKHDEHEVLSEKIKKLGTRIAPIECIRNEYIAHRNTKMTITEIFENHEVIPNNIRDIISETVTIINTIARKHDIKNTIFESNRSSQTILTLLKTLEQCLAKDK